MCCAQVQPRAVTSMKCRVPARGVIEIFSSTAPSPAFTSTYYQEDPRLSILRAPSVKQKGTFQRGVSTGHVRRGRWQRGVGMKGRNSS